MPITPLVIKTKKASSLPTLTPQAIQAIEQLLAQEQDPETLFLRLEVRPGGCAGFTYDLSFDSVLDPEDICQSFGDIKFAVDPDSLPYVRGATIDYSSSLQKSGFTVDNPNATRSCGCGNSFS